MATFKFINKENNNFSEGCFEVLNLTYNNGELNFENAYFYADGSLVNRNFSFFGGDCSLEDVFVSLINSYLRRDISFEYIGDDWNIFDTLLDSCDIDDNTPNSFYRFDSFGSGKFNLSFANDTFRYYECIDECIILEAGTNKCVTDVESFFMSALYEDIAKHILGDKKAVYISDKCQRFIEDNRDEILEIYIEANC